MSQRPYEPLSKAPKEIRIAANLAFLSGCVSRVIGIATTTAIIAILPSWVPGILAFQPLPLALLVLAFGSFSLARTGFKNREKIAALQLEKARSSSLVATILGFIVGGVIPGVLNLFLFTRIGSIMVRRKPDDPTTVYLTPIPSQGMFLGKYLGWLATYFLVLYFGYTQLPPGLANVSGWLSPVFGVHFNTFIVATYLVLTNPLTYPPLLQLWAMVGLLGGLIAGGKVDRGFTVGLMAFLSTLGAMGLATAAIFRGFSFSMVAQVPPPPPGFSLGGIASGPVVGDIVPIFLRANSALDPATLQEVVLTLLRNAMLVVAVVTISGRAGCLLWQGIAFLGKKVQRVTHRKQADPGLDEKTAPTKTLKVGVLLILLALPLLVPSRGLGTTSKTFRAAPLGPYQQSLAVGLSMLGAPNSSLRLTNLDLSQRGLVLDNNYDGNNFTAFIVNNNDPQAFGIGPQNFALRLFSEPTLVMEYTGDLASARPKADAVASQFAQALGVPFTLALAIPTGPVVIVIYSPNPALPNSDALSRVLAALPAASFSGLVNATHVTGQRYFTMLGLLPRFTLPGLNVAVGGGFSFMLQVQFPRQFYREGPHQFSLKNLLGFQGSITGDAAANVSLVSLTFQPGTILYSPLGPNPYYDNATFTYYLNATMGSAPDLSANFNYPFAPNIVVQKTVDPATGSVGSTRSVTVIVKNLDSVSVDNLNVTDPQTSSSYQATLQLSQNGPIQIPTLAGGQNRSMSYIATPTSSGTYVLSPATTEFLWTASNGTRIRYSISTDDVLLTSSSGPVTQFTRTIADLWPYSVIVLLSLVLTPLVQVLRRLGRHGRRKTRLSSSGAQEPPKY